MGAHHLLVIDQLGSLVGALGLQLCGRYQRPSKRGATAAFQVNTSINMISANLHSSKCKSDEGAHECHET